MPQDQTWTAPNPISLVAPSGTTARPRAPGNLRIQAFDYLMILATFAVIGSSAHWKVQGPLILISYLVLSIAYVTYNHLKRGLLLRNRALVFFSIVGIIHVGLSYLQWLPGKPTFYLQEYVLRMGYFTFFLWPVTAALYCIFAVVSANGALRTIAYFGIATSLFSAFAYYAWPPIDGHWVVEGQDSSLLGTIAGVLNYNISNIGVLMWWSIFYLGRNSISWLVVAVAVLGLSDAMQMKLVGLLTIIVWCVRNPLQWVRPIAAAIIFGFPVAAVGLVLFAETLGIDPNTIHRANWWVEALTAVLLSGGFALGFGADSTRDYIVDDRFDMLGKWGQLPIHVIHNDFVYSFYSMGIVGGVLLLVLHFRDFAPRYARDRGEARHSTILFLMACITTTVNSSLISPTLLIGLCWIYAYCLYLNQFARRSH